jgi:hypothetical protein
MPTKTFFAKGNQLTSWDDIRELLPPVMYQEQIHGWRRLGEDKGWVNTDPFTLKGKKVEIGAVFYRSQSNSLRFLLKADSLFSPYLDDAQREAMRSQELSNANNVLSLSSNCKVQFVSIGMGEAALMATLSDKSCVDALKKELGRPGPKFEYEDHQQNVTYHG